MTPAAVLSILVKTEGVGTATKQLGSLDDHAKRSGGSFAKLGSIAKMAGPLVGAAGLAAGVKSAIGEFREAQKIGAQTNAVIKSTGGVAKVSAKDVEKLAGAISRKTGIDDEAIQKGSNLLLTFKNIRNETGKGRDVFNQATAAAVDLSAAGFGSLESTSKQLGKALNDPIKGMTALGKSGVTFSEDQKKAISALMETGKAGDRVKAQQIILKEVQSQVGGSAAAQATAGDKLKVSLGNLAEVAGSVLVPMLDKVATVVTKVINQFIEGEGIARVIIPAFKAVGTAVGEAATQMIAAGTLAVAAVRTWITDNKAQIDQVIQAFKNIGVVVVPIVTTTFEAVLAITKNVWSGIQGVIKGVLNIIQGVVKVFAGVFTGDFRAAWEGVKQIFSGGIQTVLGMLRAATAPLRTVAAALGNAIADGIRSAVEAMGSAASALLRKFRETITGAAESIAGLGGWVVGRFTAGITAAGDAVTNAAKWLKDKIVDSVKSFLGIHSPSKVMMELGGHVVGGLIKGLTSTDVAAVIKSQLGGMVKVAGSVLKRGLIDIGDIPDAALGKLADLFGGGSDAGGMGVGGPFGNFANMIATGSKIDAQGFPYVYGGGHGSFAGPYDCSGLVSAILHSAGLISSPMTTDGLKNFGEEGPGKLVTIGVRGSSGRNAHTMMKLGNRYIESGSGHGARWVSGWSGSFPIMRHPAGYASGTMGASRGWGWVGERGPELMRFRGGEQVRSAGASAGGVSTIVQHHHHYAGPVVQGPEFLKMLRDQDEQYGRRNGKSAFGGS